MALKVNGVEISGASSTITISVPAFRATGTSSSFQNVTSGNVVPFNVTTSGGNNIQSNHDALLNYNNSSYRFTAPVDGTYVFWAQLYCHQDADQETYSFYKNGEYIAVYDTTSQFVQTLVDSADDNTIHMQHSMELSTNDYIDVRSTNNACDIVTMYSAFGGYLVGKKR